MTPSSGEERAAHLANGRVIWHGCTAAIEALVDHDSRTFRTLYNGPVPKHMCQTMTMTVLVGGHLDWYASSSQLNILRVEARPRA